MGGVTRMLSYGYDDAGNRISIKHPDGTWFGMWYDALGRRYYIHANNVLGMAMLGFAPHGGLAWVGRVGIASYIGFDAVQRPVSLAQTAYTPAASTDVAFSFARNPAGQITSLTRDNDAYAWTGHYAANRAYTANGLNQYSAAGTATFGYDANGNLTSEPAPAQAGGSRTYAYDVENRLVSMSNGAALSYDPLGRLYEVTLGTSTTRFLYDGDALVAEYDGSNTLIRRHAHWEGADVPVATFDVSGGTGLGTLRYLFADHQGSIIAEANGSGAVTAINRYDEYGIPASTNTGRFQYTGQAWLAELGMYYYKARIYSPTLGRFLQTDPVGYEGGNNLYAYVGSDPVNRADPTGQYECPTQKDCDTARIGVNQIRAARDYYRSAAPGTRFARSESSARALSGVLSSLGRENDGGVTIAEGDLPGTERGLYDPRTNTITLDTARIAATGARVGEILGHEDEHHRLRGEDLGDIAGEVRPFAIEHMIATTPGGSINPGISQGEFVRYRLHDYCNGRSADECNRAIDRAMTDELRKPY